MTSFPVDGTLRLLAAHSGTAQTDWEETEMTNQRDFSVADMIILLLCALISVSVPAGASPNTKTVEFNVKPGGVVHVVSERIVSRYILVFVCCI